MRSLFLMTSTTVHVVRDDSRPGAAATGVSPARLSAEHAAILAAMLDRLIPARRAWSGRGRASAGSAATSSAPSPPSMHAHRDAYFRGLTALRAARPGTLRERLRGVGRRAAQDALLAETERDAPGFFELRAPTCDRGHVRGPALGRKRAAPRAGSCSGIRDHERRGPSTTSASTQCPTASGCHEPRGRRCCRRPADRTGRRGRDRRRCADACRSACPGTRSRAAGRSERRAVRRDRQRRACAAVDAPRRSARCRPGVPTPAGRAGPSPWPMLMVNAVGGSTVHYPGTERAPARVELRKSLRERSSATAPPRFPPDRRVADWPLSYAELEPALRARSSGRSALPARPATSPARRRAAAAASRARARAPTRCRRCAAAGGRS